MYLHIFFHKFFINLYIKVFYSTNTETMFRQNYQQSLSVLNFCQFSLFNPNYCAVKINV